MRSNVVLVVTAVVLASLAIQVQVPIASSRPPGGSAAGAVRPVPGPMVRAFEEPAHAYAPGHRGVALAASPRQAVRAALPGTVSFSGTVARRGWVTVAHGGGLETTYGWLGRRDVSRHERVGAGQVLGSLEPDRPSLHWGARLHGRYIDPMVLLGSWEVRLVPVTP